MPDDVIHDIRAKASSGENLLRLTIVPAFAPTSVTAEVVESQTGSEDHWPAGRLYELGKGDMSGETSLLETARPWSTRSGVFMNAGGGQTPAVLRRCNVGLRTGARYAMLASSTSISGECR